MNARPRPDPQKVLAHYLEQAEIARALTGMAKLRELLAAHRADGPMPTYEQLAAIAYQGN